MKIKVEKVLSSLTYSIIWTVANFATFMNSEGWAHNNALEEIFLQSINIGVRFVGWSIVHRALEIIVILGEKNYMCKIFISRTIKI
jgi:hypothetical protein